MVRDLELTASAFLTVAIVVPLFLVWTAVFIDLYRRKDISVVKKSLWAALAILSVHVGVLIYYIFRPVPQPEGKRRRREEDRSSAIVTEIEQLHERHAAADISDDVYLTAKRELLGLGTA